MDVHGNTDIRHVLRVGGGPVTRVAGHTPDPHVDADTFVSALLEALEVPEIKMAIIRIVGRAQQTSTTTLARGQRVRK